MVVSLKCNNCGGPLTFSPKSQKFVCDYCLSEFEESMLTQIADEKKEQDLANAKQNFATNTEGGELTTGKVYKCSSCGAEIIATDTKAASFCYYCHNPIVFANNMTEDMCPQYIIPFQKSKDDMIQDFFKWIHAKRYVPKSFIDKTCVEKVVGVYFPYWISDHDLDGSFEGEGQIIKTYETSDEEVTETKYYKVVREGHVKFKNVPRLALKDSDKKLGYAILPFRFDANKNFNIAYLSGFQAERRDVNIEDIKQSLYSEVEGLMKPALTADCKYDKLEGKTVSTHTDDAYRYFMLPAWVLTYRSKGTTYFYEMNAQTGEVCGILPVNTGKLTGDSFLMFVGFSALFFGIFYLIEHQISWMHFVIPFIVSLIIVIMFHKSVTSKYKMKGSQYEYHWGSNNETTLTNSVDLYLRTKVSRKSKKD